jgi:hypothetical protein
MSAIERILGDARGDGSRGAMSQVATKGGPGWVFPCVALAAGALFGVAVQALLGHLDLDPSSVRADLATGQAAMLRLALAWWAWWIIAILAFLVGRLIAALTRFLVANRWLFGNLRLFFSAVVALALAAVGHLLAARPDPGGTTHAAINLAIVALATILAALGALSGATRRRPATPAVRNRSRGSRAWDPGGRPPPVLHAGSANAGLPPLGMRHRVSHSGAAAVSGRPALAALAIGLAVAGVFALCPASEVLTQILPPAVRKTVESTEGATGRIRSSMASMPARAGETVGQSHDTSVPLPPPRPLPARQPAAVTGAFAMVTPDDSELTFAKGYARRHAALEAAGIVPTKPRIKAFTKVKPARGDAWRADRRNRVDQLRSYDFQRSFGGG